MCSTTFTCADHCSRPTPALPARALPRRLAAGSRRAAARRDASGTLGNFFANPYLVKATCVVGPAAPKGKGKGKGKDRPCAGTVTFEQDGGAACVIEWDLTGLSPGLHALAIHEHAVFDAGLAGAGARYNPHKAKLGGPYTVEKRVGDLGNVRAKRDGTSAGRTTNAQVCLWGDFNVAGRSVVVYADADDLDAPREATARVAGGEIVMCDGRA